MIVIGTTRQPKRAYVRKNGEYVVTHPGPLSGYPRVYEPEEMVDCFGKRTEHAQILSFLGTPSLLGSLGWEWQTSSQRLSIWNAEAWQSNHDYALDAVLYADAGYWRCTTPGRSGSGGGPTGAGVFIDGSVVWTTIFPDDINTALVYQVRLWDIDAAAFVLAAYPESELVPMTSYRDWLSSGLPKNPTTVLPDAHVRTIDAASLPEDVADVARSVRLGSTR